ncbi:MAG: thiol-disulfide isomerase [Acidobacteriota bacterium]|nr:thiol-disulfide isomerase [Acidobacteriota bacterium]
MSVTLILASYASAAEVGTLGVTFNREILPILQEHCQSCHRPGQIAPMSLLTYQNVRPWAKAIKAAVVSRTMPPWNADPHYGHFRNDRSLKQSDIDLVAKWADEGSVEGDPKDKPAPVAWPPDGWQIKPDMVVNGPESKVPAHPKNNVIEWVNIVMPGGFTKDTWITSIEVRPSEPTVTHHICLFFMPHRADVKYGVPEWLDRPRDESGSLLPSEEKLRSTAITNNTKGVGPIEVCYLPGLQAADYRPFGAGKLIPAGTDIVWAVHYTPDGTEKTDRPQVGFTVSDTPPARQYVSLSAVAPSDPKNFKIPPGDPNWAAKPGEVTFAEDAELVWVSPHMHLRGRDFSFKLIYPDGKTETVLNVPRYDFNWQLGYQFSDPIRITKGTKLVTMAHYDNSPNNRFNPDPTRTVYSGTMTWEEMDTGFFAVTIGKGVNPKKVLKGGTQEGGGA